MYIEAVTTCVNYADFLDLTISENKKQFDRWLIVTTPHDIRTQKLCQQHDIEFITTNAFYEGGSFNQGKAINEGVAKLEKKGWIITIDADVLLPTKARTVIEHGLNADTLYSVPKYNLTLGDCVYIYWLESWGEPSQEIAGHFHLFHGSKWRPYDESESVEGRDADFQDRFDYWGVLPLQCFHFGVSNWTGRTSPPWPPFGDTAKDHIYRRLDLLNSR